MSRFGLIALMMSGVVACGGTDEPNNGRTPWGSGGSGGGGGGAGGTGNDTCPELVDCVGACSTDACVNACIDRGTVDAQLQFLNLAGCIQQEACNDWDCIEAKCGLFLDACFDDAGAGGGGGGAGGGGGPQGTPLPEEIVGEWFSSSGRAFIHYSFTADGHVTHGGALATGFNGCNSSWVTHYEGVAQWGANSTLSMQSTSGSQTYYDCSGNLESTSAWSNSEVAVIAIGTDDEGPFLEMTDPSTNNTVRYHHQ